MSHILIRNNLLYEEHHITSHCISIKATVTFGVCINFTNLPCTSRYISFMPLFGHSISSHTLVWFGCHIYLKVKRCINSTYLERSGCTNKRKVLCIQLKLNGERKNSGPYLFICICCIKLFL